MNNTQSKSPCKSCPYRKRVNLGVWHKDHFEDLIKYENDLIGKVYECHQKDGSLCRGYLLDQRNRDYSCTALRIQARFNKGLFDYIESLQADEEMYDVFDMVEANLNSGKY